MKTKLFSLFLALVASVGILNADVYNGTCGNNLSWSLNTADSTLTIEGSGSMNYWLNESAVPWNQYVSYIKTIVLPEGITDIGSYSFHGCYNLMSITIPNSVTFIGREAFYDCYKISLLDIPNSVTHIGDYAFLQVLNVYYNGEATGAPWGARCVNGHIEGWFCYSDVTKTVLTGCSPIANGIISIPNTVTEIDNYAFYNCDNIAEIIIPNSVTEIRGGTFVGCSSLTNVNIPNGITYIGYATFAGCSSLTSIVIPNSVTHLYEWAFEDCTSLTSISIPNNVSEIESNAFYGCSGLTSISISNNVTKMGNEVFYNCDNLSSVTINSNSIINKDYRTAGRYEPRSLAEIFGVQVSEYIIGDSVFGIGDHVFAGCSNMSSITIGKNVARIGYESFTSCESLSDVHIFDIAAWCSSIEFSDPDTYILGSRNLYLADELITDLIIPEGTNIINNGAFWGCNSITSVTIPGSVSYIGESAFAECQNLKRAYIGNGVESIGDAAFFSCKKLNTIYIPNSLEVEDITYGTFIDCSIKEIHFDGTIEDWCTSWRSSYDIFTLDSAYGGYDFYINEEKIEDLVIPEGITEIKLYIFYCCNSLKSVTFPNSATTMEENGWGDNDAFANCKNLQSVTFGNSLTKIGGEAFANCKGLTSIDIPNSVDSIGDYAFSNCTNLTSVTLGENVTNICRYAFYNCSNLESITIPHNVVEIGSHAFDNCRGMKKLVIEEGISDLGATVFSNCKGLISVTCMAKTPPTMGKFRIIAGGIDETNFVFDNVDCSKIPLYVPDESIEDYKAVEQWNWFNPILPLSQKPQEDEAIGEILSENMTSSTKKFLHDGQIFILRGDKTYTLQGQEVK